MVRIDEYNEKTSFYELFFFLYVRIIKKEILTFDQLVLFTERIPPSANKQHALKNAFYLIRKLNWGFFSQLTPDEYPKLWENLTIRNRDFSFGADLKRNMTITNIYISFIDIHGYTSFCLNSGINTSRLRKLDDFIEKNIIKIAKDNHVICKRARGDEIILAGSSALDIVEATVQIADYFSIKNIIKSSKIIESRLTRPPLLPDMTISAGIAGGKKYTPLIITSEGDLSGTVVNAAARLQAQANKISKNANRILTTNHVAGNFMTEAKSRQDQLLTLNLISLFSAGQMSFKGITLTVNEIIIDSREKYRMDYQGEMLQLIDSVRKKLWNEKVFTSLVRLICGACKKMPPFSVDLIKNDGDIFSTNNKAFIHIAWDSLDLFMNNYYQEAIEKLEMVCSGLKNIKELDFFIKVYSENIMDIYKILIDNFTCNLKKVIENDRDIYPEEEFQNKVFLKKGSELKEKKNRIIFNRMPAEKRKIIWTSTVNLLSSDIDFQIYLGK